MHILDYSGSWDTGDKLVVTVGSFDGVHLGHRDIFAALKAKAEALGGKSMVITFEPHPQRLLHPGSDFFEITSLEEKTALLQKEAVDYLLVVPFTYSLAQTPFPDFFRQFLVGRLHVRALVMGPNHFMGKNRAGKTESIRELCAEHGIEALVVPELTLEGQPVRSSRIRQWIRKMDLVRASQLLGREL